jgi:hypothetical protein
METCTGALYKMFLETTNYSCTPANEKGLGAFFASVFLLIYTDF